MSKVYTKEYAANIIDIFEDFLNERGITLPTSEKEKMEAGNDDENGAAIYGNDFDELSDKISGFMAELIKSVRPDTDVDTDIYGTTIIDPLNKVCADTPSGKLVAYIHQGDYGPQVGVYHETEDGAPTDLFLVEAKEFQPDSLSAYTYENPYEEDYSHSFVIFIDDIKQAVNEN